MNAPNSLNENKKEKEIEEENFNWVIQEKNGKYIRVIRIFGIDQPFLLHHINYYHKTIFIINRQVGHSQQFTVYVGLW